jgi:hypothetical protein
LFEDIAALAGLPIGREWKHRERWLLWHGWPRAVKAEVPHCGVCVAISYRMARTICRTTLELFGGPYLDAEERLQEGVLAALTAWNPASATLLDPKSPCAR